MFPFRNILFPVDYSAPCDAIVPHVKEMERRFTASLTLVHAYGPEALAYSPLLITDPDLADDAREHEEERLRKFATETFPGQHIEVFAELGEPGTVIRRVIQREGTDLVMLPTHGRGPVRRFLLGSVAAKVLHDISAAVWMGTGASTDEHKPVVPYESILCALDDSHEAKAVLKAAAALACMYKTTFQIVRVVEAPSTSLDIDFGPYKKELMEAADVKVRELKGLLKINAPHEVLDGPVAFRVREAAIEHKADLIVTGRGRSQATFNRIWSHVYPIVREAPCPVLSI